MFLFDLNVSEIFLLIKCSEEAKTILSLKMLLIKIHYSVQGLLSLLKHQEALVSLIQHSVYEYDEKVASLMSLIHIALLQLRRRIPALKSDITFLLDQCQLSERSLWQYSCQNHSLGLELRLAGYESLANEKQTLSEIEKTICQKFSSLLILGRQELALDSPDLIKIQEVFLADLIREQPLDQCNAEEGKTIRERERDSDEHVTKKSRSNPVEIDRNTTNQYSQTATEGDEWRATLILEQGSNDQTVVSETLTPPTKPIETEELFATPQNPARALSQHLPFHPSSATSDHTIIGSLSQEITESRSGSDGQRSGQEVNLSAVSGSSVVGSINHSTPSPEILQQRGGLRRYHSNEDRLYFVERSPVIERTNCQYLISHDENKIERRSLTQ